MKRSEIVLKLEKAFGLDCEGQPSAEDIIDFLEQNGMIPPFSSKAAAKSNEIDAAGYEWDCEDLDMTNVTRAEVPGTGKTMDELRRGEEE
jgi:hypothetical protein